MSVRLVNYDESKVRILESKRKLLHDKRGRIELFKEPTNFFSFSLNFTDPIVKTEINPITGQRNSAVVYQLKIQRNPIFYINYYCLPSFLFIIMTYCSFWIDKNSAPARASLSITVILITINFNKGVTVILPQDSGSIWLVNYFNGVLIFTIISMIEYVVLNYCTFMVFTQQ